MKIKRDITVLVIGVLLAFVLPARGNNKIEVIPYGDIEVAGDPRETSFVVKIGEPQFDLVRTALGTLVGIYHANAVLWIAQGGNAWLGLEYRVPNKNDFRTERAVLQGLEIRHQVTSETLPFPIRSLSQEAIQNIRAFFQFYSGAFRIYLRDQSETAARTLAIALAAQDAAN